MRRVVPRGHEEEAAGFPEFGGMKASVGREQLRRGAERIDQRGDETVAGCAGKPPSHQIERERRETVEEASDREERGIERNMAQRRPCSGEAGDERRIRELERHAEVPI